MENFNRKDHWEHIYRSKSLQEVSWYQPNPETSLWFIRKYGLPRDARIIDIGGGDSFLTDHLLEAGYTDLTVLDISAVALERAQTRLGDKAGRVRWILADVLDFVPEEPYDLWHDRAAFHFFTRDAEIDRYIQKAAAGLTKNGMLVTGTFSEQGPRKCSGIEVKQYSEHSLSDRFKTCFRKTECISADHQTPSGTIQNFVFCGFRKE